MIGYKLFNQRKDGSLGPLFINRRQRLEIGVEYEAEDHKTKGYAHRPGWHACLTPSAAHLGTKGRVWAEVELKRCVMHTRPANQGGEWILAESMTIIKLID